VFNHRPVQSAYALNITSEADQRTRLERIHAAGILLVGPAGRLQRVPGATKQHGGFSIAPLVMAAWPCLAFYAASSG
jgi:hypothetical protein